MAGKALRSKMIHVVHICRLERPAVLLRFIAVATNELATERPVLEQVLVGRRLDLCIRIAILEMQDVRLCQYVVTKVS